MLEATLSWCTSTAVKLNVWEACFGMLEHDVACAVLYGECTGLCGVYEKLCGVEGWIREVRS
jgi:hypothetical protein